jgi:putative ABC transport system substrate-binding protein
VVASGGTATALAVKEAGLSVPIVFVIGGDPVKFGLVKSFRQPGGNITGVSFLANSLMAKQVEVAHELISKGAKIGFLVNSSNPNTQSDRHEVIEAARKLDHEVLVETASSALEVESATAKLVRARVEVLLVAPDALFTSQRQTIISIANEARVATVYNSREFAGAGGLIGYGAKQSEAYKIAGNYVGRVLRGQKPSELPVVQSSIIELVINLKTAKLLGISVPQALLGRADEVIE